MSFIGQEGFIKVHMKVIQFIFITYSNNVKCI